MEHDTGSGTDPAASSTPDGPNSPAPAEGAGAAEGSGVGEAAGAREAHEVDEVADAADERAGAADEKAGAAAELNESEEARTSTGEPRVDAVLGRLGELDVLPVAEHPGVYERIHEQLVDVLGELHHGPQNR